MKYLSDYTENMQTAAFRKYGAFFAFGDKQFKEKVKEGIEYVSLGAGLICPKENAKALTDSLSESIDIGINADFQDNGAVKIIEREYFNHETQLTGDYDAALSALSGHIKRLPEHFTNELIKETFKNCFAQAVKNDWF
jgi:hypothetical protein